MRRVWAILAARPVATGVNAALAWVGLVSGVLAPVVVLLPVVPVAKFLAVLAFACFGPGAAVLSHLRLGDAVAAWAIALVVSLSLFALGAAVMVWTANWYPYPALLGYAVQQHAQPSRIAALRSLPQREFVSLDDVAEELLHVQPLPPDDGVQSPHEESARRRRPQSA